MKRCFVGVAAAGLALALSAADAAAAEKKTVLLFGLTKGFRHKDAIEEGSPILKQVAEGLGYNAVISEDVALLDPDKIKQWNLLVFNNTTGSLFKEPERRKAFIEHIQGGGGWIGIHGATDCFYDFPEYGEMANGWFDGHPWSGKVSVTIEEPDHPLMKPFGAPKWQVSDEIYQFRNYERGRARVLMSIDTKSVDASRGKRRDRDYATCWIRLYGKGRVLYQAHGHGANVFRMKEYQEHMKVAMQWAIGDIEADVAPSKVEDPAVVAARAVEKLRGATTDEERSEALILVAIRPSKEALPLAVPLLQPGSQLAEVAADAAQVAVAALAELPKEEKIEVLRKALDCCVANRNIRREIRGQLQKLGVRDLPIAPPAGFVAHWWAAGPLPNQASEFLGKTYPPEGGVDLEKGFTVGDQAIQWKKVASDDEGIVSLRDKVAKADALGAYLYAEAVAEKETPVQLLLGCREHYTAWLNGEKIGEAVGSKGLRPGQFKLKGTLKAGTNKLLLKVSQNKGDWGACLQITGPKGEPVPFTARDK
jgi:hypothetical protein